MSYKFDVESGRLLNQDHQRIAELINQYDPDLWLVWIPPEDRITEDNKNFPFAVVHRPPSKPEYVVFRLGEDEVDHRVLARLFEMDEAKQTVPAVARIQSQIMAQEIVKAHKIADDMQEKHELAASILASPLNTYKHNGVTYQ